MIFKIWLIAIVIALLSHNAFARGHAGKSTQSLMKTHHSQTLHPRHLQPIKRHRQKAL